MEKTVVIAIALGVVACKQGEAPAATGAGSGSPAAGSGSGSPTTGSGSSTAASGSGSAAAPGGKPLRDAITVAAGGKPVLLALDGKGQLIARTVDGGYSAVLLAGPYGDALHDAARDLVWLRRDTGLDVLDLRLPGPAVAKTLATAPDKVLEKFGEHFREPPHWDMTSSLVVYLNTPCHRGAGLVFDWTKGGVGTTTGSENVKIVAKDWFAAQEHRATRDVPPAFAKKLAKRHKVPKGVGTCHRDIKEELGHDQCGRGLYFGATSSELVIVSANSEKCPSEQCRLYDAATKKYAAVPGLAADDPGEPTCGPFLFDPGGASYLVADQVCTGASCTSVGKLAVGWLDGARVLDAN
jgi:hypothetical protein